MAGDLAINTSQKTPYRVSAPHHVKQGIVFRNPDSDQLQIVTFAKSYVRTVSLSSDVVELAPSQRDIWESDNELSFCQKVRNGQVQVVDFDPELAQSIEDTSDWPTLQQLYGKDF